MIEFLSYGGVKIYRSALLVERYLKKQCRTRKKRIIKKWMKNPRNWGSRPMQGVIRTPWGLFAHPVYYEEIVNSLQTAIIPKRYEIS